MGSRLKPSLGNDEKIVSKCRDPGVDLLEGEEIKALNIDIPNVHRPRKCYLTVAARIIINVHSSVSDIS